MTNNTTILPQKIQDYFYAMKAAEYNLAICRKHKISNNNIKKHTEIIRELYYKELLLADLIKKLMEVFNLNEEKAKMLATDIAGLKLLAVEKWLGEDIKTYINNLRGNYHDYLKHIAKLDESIIEKKLKEKIKKNELLKKEIIKKREAKSMLPVNPPSIQKEKKEAVELFNEGLLEVLEPPTKEFNTIISDFNDDLIEWIDTDNNFKKDLEVALYKNRQKLTNKEFIYENEKIKPTVMAWLRDFIKQFGTKNFSDLDLTRYVTNSLNAKKLSNNERKLLAKVLKIYRYIKFFPISMPTDLTKDWEIIPLDRDVNTKYKSKIISKKIKEGLTKIPKKKLSVPKEENLKIKTEQEKAHNVMQVLEKKEEGENQALQTKKNNLINEQNKPKIKKAITKPKVQNPRIKELEDAAAMYSIGSIEHKAIKDEIKKLSVN